MTTEALLMTALYLAPSIIGIAAGGVLGFVASLIYWGVLLHDPAGLNVSTLFSATGLYLGLLFWLYSARNSY